MHHALERFRVRGRGSEYKVDRLRVGWLNEGVPREQKMLKGHLPRVIYQQAY